MKKSYVAITIKIYLIMMLSGCTMISDTFTSEDNNAERSSEANKEIDSQLGQESNAELKRVNQVIDEFEELRPQIRKLIGMEEDISYFIEQLAGSAYLSESIRYVGNNNSESVLNSDDANKFMVSNIQEFNLTTRNIETSTSGDNDFIVGSNNLKLPPKVELGSAGKLDKFMGEPENNKFSNTRLTEDNKIKDKFMTTSNNNRQAIIDTNANSQNEQAALHLVSTSKIDGLKNYWLTTQTKLPTLFSGKQALVSLVNVNGKAFYSLRVGPFDKSNAAFNCQEVRSANGYCAVVDYSGEPLTL
jgi:hypothetical protein